DRRGRGGRRAVGLLAIGLRFLDGRLGFFDRLGRGGRLFGGARHGGFGGRGGLPRRSVLVRRGRRRGAGGLFHRRCRGDDHDVLADGALDLLARQVILHAQGLLAGFTFYPDRHDGISEARFLTPTAVCQCTR